MAEPPRAPSPCCPPSPVHGSIAAAADQLSTSGAFSWNKRELERLDLALDSPLGRPARIVNMSTLGQALTELGQGPDANPEDGPAVHALFVYNSNPGAVAPNQNAVRRGMARPDLFTVVHEQFFNDTTDFADYVLPATTFLEHTDIQGAYGHYFVQLSNQAIEPPGEARSNIWLFGQLAQYMGFPEPCFRDSEEQMIRQALAVGLDGHSTNAGMEHISFEDLKEQGHIPLAFHRDPEAHPFMPYTSGTVPDAFRQDRVLFADAGLPRASILFLPSSLQPNPAGAKTRTASRSSSWAARPTTT